MLYYHVDDCISKIRIEKKEDEKNEIRTTKSSWNEPDIKINDKICGAKYYRYVGEFYL